MAKGSYEKMEIKLEQIMQEENLDAKIQEMEDELKGLKEIKAEEISIKATSKEGYEKQFNEAMQNIEKNREQREKENEPKIQELEKELRFYKAFKENGNQILNIREYQLANQKRLEDLELEYRKVKQRPDLIEKYEEGIKKSEIEYKKLINKKEQINKKLENDELGEEDRKKLIDQIEQLDSKIDRNIKRHLNIQNKLQKLNNRKDRDIDVIENEIADTKVTISKCNVIWSCLLKGKNWDEIQTILSNKDFTAEKGTLNKIREIKLRTEKTKSNSKGKTKDQKEYLDRLAHLFGNNKKEQPEQAQPEQEQTEQEQPEQEQTEQEQPEQEQPEQEQPEQEQPEQEQPEQNKNVIDIDDYEEIEEQLPEPVKSFKERHPILAKIPFLARIIERRETRKRKEELNEELNAYYERVDEMVDDRTDEKVDEMVEQIQQNVEKKYAEEQEHEETEHEETIQENTEEVEIDDISFREIMENLRQQISKNEKFRQEEELIQIEQEQQEQEEQTQLEEEPEQEKTQKEHSEQEHLDENSKSEEFEKWKSLADNGWRAGYKADVETQKRIVEVEKQARKSRAREKLEENRRNEANRLAEKEGGRYEQQDGATGKKKEAPSHDEY